MTMVHYKENIALSTIELDDTEERNGGHCEQDHFKIQINHVFDENKLDSSQRPKRKRIPNVREDYIYCDTDDTETKINSFQPTPKMVKSKVGQSNRQSLSKIADDSDETPSHPKYCNKQTPPLVKKEFECDLCDWSFDKKWKLLRHLEVHNPNRIPDRVFKCGTCNDIFKAERYLKKHLIIHQNQRPFTCDVCNASFKAKDCLARHKKTHTKKRSFKCNVCEMSFKTFNCLQGHKQVHKPDVKCKLCGKTFTTRKGLYQHNAYHENDRPYKCNICPKTYKKEIRLRYHKKACHQEHSSSESESNDSSTYHQSTDDEVDDPSKPLGEVNGSSDYDEALENGETSQCDATLGHGESLARVKSLDVKSLDTHESWEDDESFMCDKCKKPCESRASLRVHYYNCLSK